MLREQEMIGQSLKEIAGQARPPRVDLDRVLSRVRRKRRVRHTAVAVGLAAVVITAGIWLSVGGTDVATVTDGTGRPHPTGSPNQQDGGPSLRCGDDLAMPTTRTGRHGIKLTIESMTRTPDGVPVVVASLTTSRTVYGFGPHSHPLRLVILQGGRVVAGQDAPPRSYPHWMPGGGLRPAAPEINRLQPAASTPCPGHSWSSLWGHSTAVVLADANAFFPIGADRSNPLGAGFMPGQYLISQQPLSP